MDTGGRDKTPEMSLSARPVSQPKVCEESAAVTPGHHGVGRPQWSGGEVRGGSGSVAGEQSLLGQRQAAEGGLHHEEGQRGRLT